ncbi:MAG: hypothetical protein CVU56_06670 [Deltaproteobacteria bacterium HGW-Deltaproteobacteria-14]|jgi:PAS domain S-box-containing protein|nr:MAG: hypothetical protein CVU56_06670 [Deltaproteobacteria bacterium HGW-Deltaproteobacteria-14]
MKMPLRSRERDTDPPTGAVGALGSVSEALRDAEDRAAAAARHHHDLANMLPALIAETDAAGRLTFVNRFGLALTGYDAWEWPGLYVLELVVPTDRQRAVENFARRVRGEELPPSCYRLLHRDGCTTIPVELRAANISHAGVTVGVRCVMFDLRERLAAEHARRCYEQRALDARRLESLGVLAGGVAHDFNNLLTVVLGNADLAMSELDWDAPARPYLHDIRAASRRAADITQQLLAYTGKTPLHQANVVVNAVVTDAVSQLDRALAARGRIALDLSPALPAVPGDRDLLRQVVLNLLTNALEALGDGGGGVTITTAVRSSAADRLTVGLVEPRHLTTGDHLRLSVSDDGRGMDAETAARAFEPFFSTKFTGRGLGLAVVMGVVRAHGGDISMTTAPDAGSRFDVFLPIHVAPP